MRAAYTGQQNREAENDLRVERLLNKLEQDIASGNPIPNEQLSDLKKLVDEDHPQALFLAGCYYNRQSETPESRQTALDLWKRAADLGEKKSLACLGDYYFEENKPWHWQEAWDCYTEEGARALGGQRRHAILDILNQGKYNLRILRRSVAFVVVVAFVLAVELLLGIFPAGIAVRTAGLILAVVETGAIIRKSRKTPFASLWQHMVILYGIWFVTMLLCLVF